MHWYERAGRQYRALDTFLPASLDEDPQVRKVCKLFFIDCGLCADRQWAAYLGDDHTNFAGRYLHPRIFVDRINRERFPTQAGHQQVGLIAGFPVASDRAVLRQLLEGEAYGDQTDFSRSDLVKRCSDVTRGEQYSDCQQRIFIEESKQRIEHRHTHTSGALGAVE